MDPKRRKLDENGGAISSPVVAAPYAVSVSGAKGAAAAAAEAAGPPLLRPGLPAAIDDAVLASGPPSSPTPRPGIPPSLTRTDVQAMVALLSSQQITDLLIDSALHHLNILEEVRRIADVEPSRRKIFVRGLGSDTTSDSLKSVFAQFGELEEGIVIFDKATGKSRGYGFVTFKHMDGALNALREPSKRIDGRMSVCQLASLGPANSQAPQDIANRKIYVGNIPMEWSADYLLNLFTQYGEIEEGPLGFDKQTGRSRGFALFIYKSEDAAKRLLEEPVKVIDGHQLFCKLAVEGLRQKVGGIQGQHDVLQAGANPMTMQYGTAPHGMMPTGAPYGPTGTSGLNPAVNPVMNALSSAMNQSMTAAVNASFGVSNQAMPSQSSIPASFSSQVSVRNPNTNQVQTSVYGYQAGISSQGPPYGSQTAGYSGVAGLGGTYAAAPHSTLQTPSLQAQTQYGSSYQSQQQYSSSVVPRSQTGVVVPSMPFYGM